MKNHTWQSLTVVTILLAAGCASFQDASSSSQRTYNAELAYLRAIHDKSSVGDDALTLLLMSEFISSRRTGEGIDFFEHLLKSTNPSPQRRPFYMACLGALRASHAEQVSLLSRINWVKDSIELLQAANDQSGGQNITIRWIRGTVLAQLPGLFDQTEHALEDLVWVLDRFSELPEPGMLREVYFQLASVHRARGNMTEANSFLMKSGYQNFDRPIAISSTFAVNAETGHTFHPQTMKEIVPGKVFALSGYEFTEYYFVVTGDGKQLVSIDTGTRPDAAQLAYESLMARHPNLPPLTTVLVTHAHWDHIGGYKFFRELNPHIKFISRDNYQVELELMKREPGYFKWFFGTRYTHENLAGYRPDQTVSERTEILIGGTRFNLIPITGGETEDGLFIHLPQHRTVFVGDFVMPFIGAPFVPEGNPDGLFDAIDLLASLGATHVLHGHETLTRRFNPPATLSHLKSALQWLKQETYKAHLSGLGRADIHSLNLIAPVIIEHPDAQFTYLVMRENFINRVFEQMTGYWKHNLDGMDYLGDADYGNFLSGYLGYNETSTASLIRNMIERGDYALAARVVRWGLRSHPQSQELDSLRRLAYLKLKEKYQFMNPFKLIIYSEQSQNETLQLKLP